MENNKIIKVENLIKKYQNDILAVNNISFQVRKGEFFAFLGPNGAGKSTTINILATLLEKTSGKVFIDNLELGKKNKQIRKQIGVVFQENFLDNNLTIKENLLTRGKLYFDNKRELYNKYNFVISFFNLKKIENRFFKNLSGGQKRKCEIARALISNPKILILDEPTTGLDPQSRKDVWRALSILKKDFNLTIFLTTHYMEEANESDYIIVINNGKIAANGTPIELKEKYTSDFLYLYSKEIENVENILKSTNLNYLKRKTYIKININNTVESLSIINRCSHLISSFEVIKGSLDDVFINITKENSK